MLLKSKIQLQLVMGGSCWGGRRGSTADFNGKYVVWQTVGMAARVCACVCVCTSGRDNIAAG